MPKLKNGLLPQSDLEQLATEILERASELGCSENYLFQTTFARYRMQLEILSKLAKEVKNLPVIVTKKYGAKENEYINPAISEYNKTASAANGTVATLVKILSNLGTEEEEGDQPSELQKFRRGDFD